MTAPASSPDGGAATDAVVRRAPFSDSPHVGARGQQTQQRILDAALGVFGEEGYHQCSIDAIAKRAGCSRVSFYQYFASKEDVFRDLAGQVARQAQAAIEALGPMTPDAAGWRALRDWVERHARIYERYEPVFRAFDAASETDELVAVRSARWGERHVARFRSGVTDPTVPTRRLDPLITLLMESQHQTLDVASILRATAPDAYTPERVEDAITDVMHRSLFGRRPRVNSRAPTGPRPPRIEFDPATWALLQLPDSAADSTAGRQPARDALMLTSRAVFLDRGYHRTRVDDLVTAAGVSHGAFYRYFKNKDELARHPDVAGHAQCRDRVRRGSEPRCARRPGGPCRVAPLASPLQRDPRQRGGDAPRLARRRVARRRAQSRLGARIRLGTAAHDALSPTPRLRRRRARSVAHGHAARRIRRSSALGRRDRRRRSHHRAGTARPVKPEKRTT